MLMKILIYGASGMVGQGVLRECLKAEDVEKVTVIVRSPLAAKHPKLEQVVTDELTAPLTGGTATCNWDACFFCLGVSASGMSEEKYSRVTFDLTLDVASRLVQLNPAMMFIYVSGAGTDSTETGRSMWARVKGKTENALLRAGFASALMFRPAMIQPLNGIRSKTASYRIFYYLVVPFFSLLRGIFPDSILTTEDMGKAMLNAVRYGYSKPVLEKDDISRLARK